MLQGAADFTGGFFNALGSDEVLGAGRRDQPTPTGKVGAAFGDATATIQGLSEFTGGLGDIDAGIGGEALGIGLDATGVGILPGVVINVASAGLVVAGIGLAVHGGAVGLTGAAHLGTDAAQLTHLAMSKANKGGSSEPLKGTQQTGGGAGLSQAAKNKLGNLQDRAGETVADVIKSRGGKGSNVREVGHWAQMTLGETAQAAANGDRSAEKAIKIVKQAAQKGQQH